MKKKKKTKNSYTTKKTSFFWYKYWKKFPRKHLSHEESCQRQHCYSIDQFTAVWQYLAKKKRKKKLHCFSANPNKWFQSLRHITKQIFGCRCINIGTFSSELTWLQCSKTGTCTSRQGHVNQSRQVPNDVTPRRGPKSSGNGRGNYAG